jgi:hypothetical protein
MRPLSDSFKQIPAVAAARLTQAQRWRRLRATSREDANRVFMCVVLLRRRGNGLMQRLISSSKVNASLEREIENLERKLFERQERANG